MWAEMHVEEAILVLIHSAYISQTKWRQQYHFKRGTYATLGAEAHRVQLNETGSR